MKSILHRRKDKPGSVRLSNDSTKRVPGQWRWVRQGGDPVVVVVTGTPCHGMDSSDIGLPPALSPLGQNHICLPCFEHQNQRGCRFGEWSTQVGGIRGCLPTCGQESRENHPAALEGVPAQVGLPHIGLFFTFPPYQDGFACLVHSTKRRPATEDQNASISAFQCPANLSPQCWQSKGADCPGEREFAVWGHSPGLNLELSIKNSSSGISPRRLPYDHLQDNAWAPLDGETLQTPNSAHCED